MELRTNWAMPGPGSKAVERAAYLVGSRPAAHLAGAMARGHRSAIAAAVAEAVAGSGSSSAAVAVVAAAAAPVLSELSSPFSPASAR